MAPLNPPATSDDPQTLYLSSPPPSSFLLQSPCSSTSSNPALRETAWKREISELRVKCELMEEVNRSVKMKLEEEKAERELERYSLTVENEKLKDKLTEMQNQELKVEERNRKLIKDACEARKERAMELDRVFAESRESKFECTRLEEGLRAIEMELEETKMRYEERISEMITANEALKGELATKEGELAMLTKDNESLELGNNSLEASLKSSLMIKERNLAMVVAEKEKLKEENTSLEASLKSELALKERDLAMLVMEKERLENENKSIQTLRSELVVKETHLEMLVMEKERLEEESKSLEDYLNGELEVKERDLKVLVKEKEILEARNKSLEASLKGELVLKERDHAMLLIEKERLEEENKSVQTLRNELAVKEKNLEMLVMEKERLEEQNMSIEALRSDLEVKERDLKMLVMDKERLEEESRSIEALLNRELELKERKFEMLVKEKERLQDENRSSESELGNRVPKLKSHVEKCVCLDSRDVESRCDSLAISMIKTSPEIGSESGDTIPLREQNHNSKINVIELTDSDNGSDNENNNDDGSNFDDDTKPLSELLRLKRPRSEMLNGDARQILDGDDSSTPRRHKTDHELVKDDLASKSATTSSPACETDHKPMAELVKQETECDDQFSVSDKEFLISCQKSRPWLCEAELISALESDPELCLKAICALYRQHKIKSKYAVRGVRLAEHLINNDPEGRLRRSVREFESYHRLGIEECRKIAKKHKSELFEIHKNSLDLYFP